MAGLRPRVALLACGRATFDLQAAEALLERSRQALLPPASWSACSELVTDPAAAAAFVRRPEVEAADLLVCQFTTFVDARFVAAAAEATGVPLVLWALREPSAGPGGRLALNSLTGANLAAHTLYREGRPFTLLMGDPEEPALRTRLGELALVGAVRRWLQGLTVAVLGRAPDGFTFCDPSPAALQRLGVRLVRLTLPELFAAAAEVPPAAWEAVGARIGTQLAGVGRIPSEQVERYARLQVAVELYLAETRAQAVAVRCWPEFFTVFGGAACSFVSVLNDQGIPAACEADILGALSMAILSRLAGSPSYLGDLAALDRERDAVVFWHCGAGAMQLADPKTGGARAGLHPNRGIGLTLEFALRPGRVTVARLGEDAGGLRLLIAGGQALPAPQPYRGTAGTVRLDGEGPVEERIRRLLEAGWEPHYALVYGDIRHLLADFARLCGLPSHAL